MAKTELEKRVEFIESAIGGWSWPDNAESRIKALEQHVFGEANPYKNPRVQMVNVKMIKWKEENPLDGYEAISRFVIDHFGDELHEDETISGFVLDILSVTAKSKE